MSNKNLFKSPEVKMLVVLFLGAVLSLVFLSFLVAEPKALFGRSLSAIAPTLFPGIVLFLMAVMCGIEFFMIRAGTVAEPEEGMSRPEWVRAAMLFGTLTLFALTMQPFGFLISTAIATTLISLQMGARSPIQIALVAIVGPVALYLAATQLLAVSLPELNSIELFYSRVLSLLSGGTGAGE
ncbi:putative tricarboxylic transport membrane protein [Octadecabacter temperatus]|uniref:Tripartite tricarboxylate transporter TctB family protein n=1 Tax=Octadecabacter temperatus TaxID=1458307 RepID=A0A0K0Y8A1_9RHOB|nr:tripartite tricarboxylate transporter TctB family protein [Octadecabacter temperatus]AKS47199.1 Tripartite tricarboxylate transporter TctB family protein [Octadecabacter temperatus]SIO45390.1 putative tricarboxylic transport membrane protein [Octadecabacter temperatus]